MPLAEALAYAVQIVDTLDKAHRASVVHRDVSLDGQQFLMIKTDASPRTRIRIVQNFSRELERLAPLPE